MATSKKLKLALISFMLFSFLLMPALAQEEAPPIEEQLGEGLKIAYGVPEATDVTFAWVRFGLFLLMLIVMALVFKEGIPIVKDNTAAAYAIAFIISYMAIRFTPDSSLYIFMLLLPILGVVSLLYLLYHSFKTLTKGAKAGTLLIGVLVILAGLVLNNIFDRAKEIVPIPTEALQYVGWMTFIIIILIIIGIILTIKGGYDLFSGLGKGFKRLKDEFKGTKRVNRGLNKEFKKERKAEKINKKKTATSKRIVKDLENAFKAVKERKFKKAIKIVERIIHEVEDELKDLNKERKNLETLEKRALRNRERILKKEKTEDRRSQERKIDDFLRKVERRDKAIEDAIEKLENYERTLLKEEEAELKWILEELERIEKGNLDQFQNVLEGIKKAIRIAEQLYDEEIIERKHFRQLEKLLKEAEIYSKSEVKRIKKKEKLEKKAEAIEEKIIKQLEDVRDARTEIGKHKDIRAYKDLDIAKTIEEKIKIIEEKDLPIAKRIKELKGIFGIVEAIYGDFKKVENREHVKKLHRAVDELEKIEKEIKELIIDLEKEEKI
ncbi:hypothetical protein GF374_02430 [Candidatus Woesearchaeota archaeon]|nr:hypothetical protein [Candidatus Woesearchaeota archaeon]